MSDDRPREVWPQAPQWSEKFDTCSVDPKSVKPSKYHNTVFACPHELKEIIIMMTITP